MSRGVPYTQKDVDRLAAQAQVTAERETGAASDGLEAWLRQQIEGDLSAARIIGAGGFEPQRWDTEPPGQVNPEPVPFRAELNAVVIPDEEDRCDREGLPYWVQVVSYDRELGDPPECDGRDSDLPVMLVDDGRREVDHIIRHDPRNVVADCEAKLAILDKAMSLAERFGEESLPGRVALDYVESLASAYRHRPGYREEWKP